MSDPNTIRILELDGGGERGYMSTVFFQQFIQQWGIDPSTVAENFDVICGTSIGGIVALSLAFGKTPDEILPFFTTQGPYIFSLTSLVPSVRPNLAAKVALIALGTPFYQSSGLTEASYGSGLLAATLQSNFGTNTLQNLKTNVIIPTYEQVSSTYTLCSNTNYPDFVGQNELITNVALATSAAPVYLPPLIVDNSLSGTLSGTYLDGGIYQNNPASFGLTLGQMLKPNASRYCVLSLGTGIGEIGFDPGNPDMIDPRVGVITSSDLKAFDNIATIFALGNIARVGAQESVAKALDLESEYTLNQLYYYRFQPKLDSNVNTELDNTDPAILTYYNNVATTTFNSDIENISTFIGHLTA